MHRRGNPEATVGPSSFETAALRLLRMRIERVLGIHTVGGLAFRTTPPIKTNNERLARGRHREQQP
jgi:hypothetical protein